MLMQMAQCPIAGQDFAGKALCCNQSERMLLGLSQSQQDDLHERGMEQRGQ